MDPRSPNNFLKDNIISKLNTLEEQELKNLTSKSLAKDHTKEDVRLAKIYLFLPKNYSTPLLSVYEGMWIEIDQFQKNLTYG